MKNPAATVITALMALITFGVVAQSDDVGPGHALSFDGAHDYLEVGNIYDDLKLPISVSAWVYLESNAPDWSPIFVSQDNLTNYGGFWVLAQPTIISIGFGDGTGTTPSSRRGKTAAVPSLVHRWVHIAIVIRSGIDMDIYLNGIDVGGQYTGSTSSPMSSSPTDLARIGLFHSSGALFLFNGKLDHVQVWNISRSASDIREFMCKKNTGDETGLIGYWKFDELGGSILKDGSQRKYDAKLSGTGTGPARVFSGAAIGEESAHLYTKHWEGSSVSLENGNDKLTVRNVRSDPEGVHVYSVGVPPSQTGGLDPVVVKAPYFGVFVASLQYNSLFDISYSVLNKESCAIFDRADNSVVSWRNGISQPIDVLQQSEFLKGKDDDSNHISLGDDKLICEGSATELMLTDTESISKYEWSTAETTPTIVVKSSGKYWVKVINSKSCLLLDTINVGYQKLSLNDIPTVITPNGDAFNQYFDIGAHPDYAVSLKIINRWGKQVYWSEDYKNDWDGGGLATENYFFVVSGSCIHEVKGSLLILR